MLLAAANKANASAMDYYLKRMKALKESLPQQTDYDFEVKTHLLASGFPVTTLEMTRLKQTVKIWILTVSDEELENPLPSHAEVISLKKFSNWSKVKRLIILQIREIISGLAISEETPFLP